MTVKTRVIPAGLKAGRKITFDINHTIIQNRDVSVKCSGFELTSSEGHAISLLGKRWFNGNIGGSFVNQTVRLEDKSPILQKDWKGSNGYSFSHTGVYPVYWTTHTFDQSDFGSLASNNDMIYWGTAGFSRASPTRPKSSLTTALFELREGIPLVNTLSRLKNQAQVYKNMWEARKIKRLLGASRHAPVTSRQELIQLHAKALANGYLTWEFEWLPFVSDVSNFIHDVRRSHSIYLKFFKEGRQKTRRRLELSTSTNTSTVMADTTYYGADPYVTQAYSSAGKLSASMQTERHFWFSGAFSYYIPPPTSDAYDKTNAINTLLRVGYGVEITPRSLWNAMPWSWLYDWTSNTGTILSNLTDLAHDNMASPYAYVMCETKSVTTYSLRGVTLKDGTSLNGMQQLVRHNKQRVQASPFGFAVTPNQFTDRQWSILTALGIARAKGVV